MKHRLSNQQAAAKAKEIATQFMSSIDTNGWSWEFAAAIPDPANPELQGRKVANRWVVVVRWTREGCTVDGGGVVVVDIGKGTATLES